MIVQSLSNDKRRSTVFSSRWNVVSDGPSDLQSCSGHLQRRPYHTVGDFAEFFVNKVTDIWSATSNAPPAMIAFCQTPLFSQFNPVTVKEVYEQLARIPSKSCCLDPIPTWLVKQLEDTLAPVITSLCNCSFQTGVLPAAHKQAIVLPRLKKPTLNSSKFHQFLIWVHFQTGGTCYSKQICLPRQKECTVSSSSVLMPAGSFNGDSHALCPQWHCVRCRWETNRCSSVIRSEHRVRHSGSLHSTHGAPATVRCLQHSSHMAPVVSVRSHSEVPRRQCDVTTDQRQLQRTTRLHVRSCRVHHLHRGRRNRLQEARSQASPVCGRRMWMCLYRTLIKHGLHFNTASLTLGVGVRHKDCS